MGIFGQHPLVDGCCDCGIGSGDLAGGRSGVSGACVVGDSGQFGTVDAIGVRDTGEGIGDIGGDSSSVCGERYRYSSVGVGSLEFLLHFLPFTLRYSSSSVSNRALLMAFGLLAKTSGDEGNLAIGARTVSMEKFPLSCGWGSLLSTISGLNGQIPVHQEDTRLVLLIPVMYACMPVKR